MRKITEEFRIRNYIHIFEKSLNYMVGVILAVLIAVISWYVSSEENWKMTLLPELKNIHDDPREVLCLAASVLSTLPYYFLYALKDNGSWNAYVGGRDNKGLEKLFILYEICIMSFFYVLLQGDISFSASKLVASAVNVILVGIYIVILLREHKREPIGYSFVVIILLLLLFIVLFVNSLYRLVRNVGAQNYAEIFIMAVFFINALINLIFLTKWDSCEEIGIISNRIRVSKGL